MVENPGPSCYNLLTPRRIREFPKTAFAVKIGRLAQLVRALPSHGRGQRFKSFVAHHFSGWPIYFLHLVARRAENVGFLCSTRYLHVRLLERTGYHLLLSLGLRGPCGSPRLTLDPSLAGLGDPLGGDGVFGAAVAAAAAGVGVGPGSPVFLVEELDEDSLLVGAPRATQRCDDGVLLVAVEDAVDEHGEVRSEQREVDAELAECRGFSGLRDGRWDLMPGDGGGFERFALIGVFAGGGDRVDEGVAVSDDQSADDPSRDVVLAQIFVLISQNND